MIGLNPSGSVTKNKNLIFFNKKITLLNIQLMSYRLFESL